MALYLYSFTLKLFCMAIKQPHTVLWHKKLETEVNSDDINFRFTNTGHDAELRDGSSTILELRTILGSDHHDLNMDIDGFEITNPDGSTDTFENLDPAIEHCKTKFRQYK